MYMCVYIYICSWRYGKSVHMQFKPFHIAFYSDWQRLSGSAAPLPPHAHLRLSASPAQGLEHLAGILLMMKILCELIYQSPTNTACSIVYTRECRIYITNSRWPIVHGRTHLNPPT